MPDSAKIAISGMFGPLGANFGGHLQANKCDDAAVRVEVVMQCAGEARWTFVCDRGSIDLAHGFCTWLSWRSRDGFRVQSFALQPCDNHDEAQVLATSFLNGLMINPRCEFTNLGPSKQSLPNAFRSELLLQFPRRLRRMGNEKYRNNMTEKSLDFYSSALLALSEWDEILKEWNSSQSRNILTYHQLSFDVLSSILQVHLYQQNTSEVYYMPLSRMIEMSFDEGITISSRVRFLRLCARYRVRVGNDSQAFLLLLVARCLDASDELVVSMLRDLRPTAISTVLSIQFIGQYAGKRKLQNELFAVMTPIKSASIQSQESCPICLLPLKVDDDQSGFSDLVITPCKHHFHTICMRQLFVRHTRCPLCRCEWKT